MSGLSDTESLPDYLPPQYGEVFQEDSRLVTLKGKGGFSVMELDILRSVVGEVVREQLEDFAQNLMCQLTAG